MAYNDFTLNMIFERFGIQNKRTRILEDFSPLKASEYLKKELKEVEELPIRSEKAKSEWIVVPILLFCAMHDPSDGHIILIKSFCFSLRLSIFFLTCLECGN